MRAFITATLLCFICIDLDLNAQSLNWQWAKSVGDAITTGISTDAYGNAYVIGYFYGPTVTIGNTTLVNNSIEADSGANIFIAKFDSAGSIIWVKNADGDYNGTAVGIVTDAKGNSYITGLYSTTIIFGGDTLSGHSNIGYDSASDYANMFVAKYDALGNAIWGKTLGAYPAEVFSNPVSISLAADGSIYTTGWYSSPTFVTFGADTFYSYYSIPNYFIRYDTSGNVLWAKSVSTDAVFTGLSTDNTGSVYIEGDLSGDSVTFANLTLKNNHIFLVKYDSTGNVLWGQSIGGSTDDYGLDISIDVSGNVYLLGQFGSTSITVGNMVLTNYSADSFSRNPNFFIAKIDSGGNVIWAKNNGVNIINCIGTDVQGNFYASGNFGTYPFNAESDTLPYSSAPADYMNIIKCDSSGNITGALGVMGYSYKPIGIRLDDHGNFFITGKTFPGSEAILGTDTLTENFVAKSGNCFPFLPPANTTSANALTVDSGDVTTLTVNSAGATGWYDSLIGGKYLAAGKSYTTPGLNTTTTFYVQDSGVCGASVRAAITVTVPGSASAILNFGKLNVIGVSPNPSTSTFNFTNLPNLSTIEIANVLGQQVYSAPAVNSTYQLNLGSQAKGIYFYRVIANANVVQGGKMVLE